MKIEKELVKFLIITILIAVAIAIFVAIVTFENGPAGVWGTIPIIILLEWLVYRLWLGKKKTIEKKEHNNEYSISKLFGCLCTGILVGMGAFFLIIKVLMPLDIWIIVESIVLGLVVFIVESFIIWLIYDALCCTSPEIKIMEKYEKKDN